MKEKKEKDMQPPANRERLYASYDGYHQVRKTQPVYFDPHWKSWHVFRYADVSRVLNDDMLFSVDENRCAPKADRSDSPIGSSLLHLDPPRHRKLRNLVSQAFTPRMVAQLKPRIQNITHALLDHVMAQGHMDMISDVAYPLPVTVIAELLGIPVDRREEFKRWSDALIAGGDDVMTEEEKQAFRRKRTQEASGMYTYFTQVLGERRERPQNDLVSALLAAQIDGEHLSTRELLGFCGLLLVAGHETTTNLIGNLLLCLDENSGTAERLRANRTLVPGAIEEALRYYSPVKVRTRYTTTEVTLGDQRIEAGQTIHAWIGPANRDATAFPDPDQFDIEREPNRHLGFGRGIHFCLGAPLARLEAKIVLNSMLDRFPDGWHLLDVPLEPIKSFTVFGTRNLPLSWRA